MISSGQQHNITAVRTIFYCFELIRSITKFAEKANISLPYYHHIYIIARQWAFIVTNITLLNRPYSSVIPATSLLKLGLHGLKLCYEVTASGDNLLAINGTSEQEIYTRLEPKSPELRLNIGKSASH